MITEQIDNLFTDWNSSSNPGCAIGIVRNNQLVYSTGYGVSDIDDPIPIDEDTLFDIGSEVKQFTGASILLLANDKVLDLESDIHDYIPELPDYGHRVTVNHLAHHTSGIPDYYDSMMDAGLFEKPCMPLNILDFLERRDQLDFMPGYCFSYSNSGYVILASIVERITGLSFAHFVKNRLFRLAGMTASFVQDKPLSDNSDIAKGHDCTPERKYVHREFSNYAVPGPGSLYSSVRDLSRWVCALQNSKSALFDLGQQMLIPGILNSGENTKYGFGLDWGQCFKPPDSLNVITHSGGYAGFCSIVLRCPEKEFGVIILCNTRDIKHQKMAFSIFKMIMNEK